MLLFDANVVLVATTLGWSKFCAVEPEESKSLDRIVDVCEKF
jgi:hypothetical protein